MSEVVKINPDLPMLDRPDALNFEANRLKTFDGWSGPVSACRLSRDGFFKSGDGNETQCFSCGEKYSRWSEADKPHEVHRRLSPRCRMVREHCHEMDPRGVGPNIPIPLRHPQSFAVRYPAFETFCRLVCRQPIKESGAVEPDNYVNGILGVNLRHVQFPNRADGNLRIGRSPDGSLPYTAQADVELVPAPCYPHFSSAVIRHSSFSTFSLTHLVEQLVRNGFFSVGHGDIVLCYSCGLALYNWLPRDDPKIVHTRWRPSCPHLQMVERSNFIQRAAREMGVVGDAL